jgi:hypothetical protein
VREKLSEGPSQQKTQQMSERQGVRLKFSYFPFLLLLIFFFLIPYYYFYFSFSFSLLEAK